MNKKYWSARIRDCEPYVPGEQPKDRKYVKLNTNENPYPPSEAVLAAARQAANDALRLYPDPVCGDLRLALADRAGLKLEQVFVGNGSDEVLAFCFAAFTDEKTPAVFPDVTYSFYPVYAEFFGAPTRVPPLNDDFTMPLEELKKNDGCIFLTNPNAPTGIALELDVIEDVLRANPDQVVVVDEAYVDFGAESAVCLVDRYENLLVVQTMSKSRSLAGQRVGFAYGCENLISALTAVKDSFNSYTLDRVAQAAGLASVLDEETFREHCSKVVATRERTVRALENLGLQVLPSKANFVFARHEKAAQLFAGLKERGVLVRYFAKPRIDTFLRISIGTDEEMDILLRELESLLQEIGAK
ncbi:MAG: histidinol-phosphate transaminase [Ruminococcaceae bacterium]|nr:histidinol-phosphate transaminase [Oscillospiraceae bacterium]